MRRFFHATFITRLLQLPELPCFDFQGLKKNNVHDIVIWWVPHSANKNMLHPAQRQDSGDTSQAQTAVEKKILQRKVKTTNMVNIQAHSFPLPCYCIEPTLSFQLATKGKLLSFALVWYFQLLKYSQTYTKCVHVANAHTLYSTNINRISSHLLSCCFLVLVIYNSTEWVEPKKQADQVLNHRG